ncbi:demethylmenaquinone methyltransferase [Dietzia sp.]|uniref:demethylmenaquinone methyltransferase n=1 Tax=Dietzia sp. TaxID=1871616 RepID=UPI002FDB90FC
MSRADLDKKPGDVASMFDGVAARYDITNTVLTGGLDAAWRARTRSELSPRPGEMILDLAAGTSVSTVGLAKSGAYCVAGDFSLGMLKNGAKRDVPKVAADAMALPFGDGVFDAVTISFGLRNVADTAAGLREMARVTRPGGRLVVCEFSQPVFGPFRTVYIEYIMRALPAVARRVSSNPEAYVYLAESIREWPAQSELADLIDESGWRNCRVVNLTGGMVALHIAEKAA